MSESEKPTYIDKIGRFLNIDGEKAFNGLDNKERNYCYYFSRASWEGAKICYFQRSYEAPALFYMLSKIFTIQSLDEIKTICLSKGWSDEEWRMLTAYIAGFFQNCGNYLSFGDKKFIPEIPKEKFLEFIHLTEAYSLEPEKFDKIWNDINLELYEYKAPYGELGYTDKGCLSSYYSSNMTQEDCKFADEFMQSIDLSPLNTRVIKHSPDHYEILVCSYKSGGKVYNYKDKKFSVVYGDFSPFMYKVITNLKECIKYAANENQVEMLKHYIRHFETGDINAHKDSQRAWIRDKNPIVETCIGFIEVYLDPNRTKGEFEGFVSVVDKEQSKKLAKLVDNAEKIITNLTWPKELEIEKFSKPDFTSLDVLTFACSGTPIGINLPNYEDVTRNDGFKNVNLGNCYGTPNKQFSRFLRDEDVDIVINYSHESDFVMVALHELLGHGTGKLFVKKEDGTFNFNKDMPHPLTGGPITTWYEPTETWGSKFGKVSSGYEECRADGVALYLSTFEECLEILLPGRKEVWDDIVYGMWLQTTFSGLTGLKYYSPETQEWGQAHVCASFALLQVLIEAGNGMIKIEETTKDGKPYMYYHLDRTQIHTTGKKAIGEFLRKLQIYKSLGEVEEGTKFFEGYTKVNEDFLRYRTIVLENKTPDWVELQHDFKRTDDGNVEYVKFEESFEGIIKSQVYHYRDTFEDVYAVWSLYKDHFKYKASQ